ncbi:hypothetical protein Tco_1147635 [Tanacetum coccineum]
MAIHVRVVGLGIVMGLEVYWESNETENDMVEFSATTVTTPALWLHPLKHFMVESVVHPSAGPRPLEFQVGDKVMLKVSPWKGVIRFGKQGKLNPRYIGPFKVLAKKCLSDESLVIPLEEIQIDDKLHFIEEPVEIMDQEVKQLKQSRIPTIKVRILQKSQENGQNRTNTDTGKEREYKSRENAIKGQQKLTLGQH